MRTSYVITGPAVDTLSEGLTRAREYWDRKDGRLRDPSDQEADCALLIGPVPPGGWVPVDGPVLVIEVREIAWPNWWLITNNDVANHHARGMTRFISDGELVEPRP